MLAYTVRRLFMALPVMGVVALVVFTLLYFVPGDPAVLIAGDSADMEEIARVRAAYGLDQGYVVRFFLWVWNVLQGDLGRSIFTNQPVTQMIAERLVPTFSLLIFSTLIAVGIAVPMGALAAWNRGKAFDRVFMILSVAAFSIPVFVIGYVLIYALAMQLGWLPVQGYSPPERGVGAYLSHLVMPSLALGASYAALIARVTRASMIEVLSQDYVRTAVAKGVMPRGVLFRHALRNAAVPILTVVGIGIATLIGGSVVIETVFGLPGLGRLTVEAILHRDYPVIQGVVLLFSLIKVLLNLIIDLSYTIVDPRIRY